jgi:hypothetical protein
MLLAVCPLAAASTPPIGWQKYVVPETGANVDFPNEIFSQDAGPPDWGYGRGFQTSDGRANLTVNSIDNNDNDSPASFLRKHFALPPRRSIGELPAASLLYPDFITNASGITAATLRANSFTAFC